MSYLLPSSVLLFFLSGLELSKMVSSPSAGNGSRS